MRQGSLLLAAGRVRSKKQTRNPAAPKTHHEIHSSPATVTTTRRRATKQIPRVTSSPYSPASIDPGFVEIDLVQLSQSVKTTNVTHAYRLNNGTLYAPRYEETFLPYRQKNGLGCFAPSALPHYKQRGRADTKTKTKKSSPQPSPQQRKLLRMADAVSALPFLAIDFSSHFFSPLSSTAIGNRF